MAPPPPNTKQDHLASPPEVKVFARVARTFVVVVVDVVVVVVDGWRFGEIGCSRFRSHT